jgi:hypothetical protein
MASDFSHGWTSTATSRLYRIEVTSNLTTDNDYVFSIDAVKFTDLPNKAAAASARKSITATTTTSQNNNRNSITTDSASKVNSNQNRASFQSPNEKSKSKANNTSQSDFDPFASGSQSNAFDPFASNSNPANVFGDDPFASSSTAQKNNAAFDPFGPASSTPVATQNRSQPASASNLAARTSTASIFGGVEDDPFALTSSNTVPAAVPATKSNSAFDLFGNDSIVATKSSSNTFDPFAAPAGSSQNAFNSTSNNAIDMNQTPPAVAPGRRSSAVEISMDFAGLSFGPPQGQLSAHPRDKPQVVPEPEAVPAPKDEGLKDPWSSNLVDLNLSSNSNPIAPGRRTSISTTAGPSLNSMLPGNANTANPQRRASVNNTVDPYSTDFSSMRPINSAQAISSLGPGVPPANTRASFVMPPGGAPGYGASGYATMPPTAPYQTGPASASGRASFIAPNNNAGMPMNFDAPQNSGASFVAGAPMQPPSGYAKPNRPNSLDSLNWKTGFN